MHINYHPNSLSNIGWIYSLSMLLYLYYNKSLSTYIYFPPKTSNTQYNKINMKIESNYHQYY